MSESSYVGILAIGDPHLESRTPGFRKDDYPHVALEKLRWCLDYARGERLLPVLLGDLFHLPRDNANWLLGELMELFDPPVLSVYGNHDVSENTLTDHDSISVLRRAGKLRMLSPDAPWQGEIQGTQVILGGTAWGNRLPKKIERKDANLVFWVAHHDVKMPGYEEAGRLKPGEIPGVDVVINGHIHRRLEDVPAGQTHWINPGNITRRARSDASRQHVPATLRIDIQDGLWQQQYVEVPHRPFDEVFHAEIVETAENRDSASQFVAGLAELQARRTDSAAGLFAFLEQNADQFEPGVTKQIMALAQEVTAT